MNSFKETLIIVGITIAAFVGIIWLATPDQKAPAQAGVSGEVSKVLITQENKFDFGTISMAAGKVTHAFKFKNTSAEPLTITTTYTSCMCTSATLVVGGVRKGPFGMPGHGFLPKLSEIVSAGEEIEVEVVFDPAAHGPAGVGPISRAVTLETSSGSATMNFSAVVTP